MKELKKFIEKNSMINKSAFSRKLGITPQHLHHILQGGSCSKALKAKIQLYLGAQDQKKVIDEMKVQLENLQTKLDQALSSVKWDFCLLFNLTKSSHNQTYESFLERSSLKRNEEILKKKENPRI